jgi:hypothetical protein
MQPTAQLTDLPCCLLRTSLMIKPVTPQIAVKLHSTAQYSSLMLSIRLELTAAVRAIITL